MMNEKIEECEPNQHEKAEYKQKLSTGEIMLITYCKKCHVMIKVVQIG